MKTTEKTLHFCLTMCSRQRPELLSRALDCLSKLIIPDGVALTFLIVENNESNQYADIIAKFAQDMDITHVLEPRPGLTFARNKVLDELQEMQVDWMGGVDDDQIIDPNWLVSMIAAIRQYRDTKMFVGDWYRHPPKEMPYWYPQQHRRRPAADGARLREAATGNIAMHKSVYDPSEMGLRFDPAYNLLGGEDTDIGAQYLNSGGIIRFVKGARTDEDIHAENLTLGARINRIIASEYIIAKVRHRRNSAISAWLWTLQILYRSAVFGFGNLILAGVALPFRERFAMRRFGMALKFFAKIRGLFRYYLGKQPVQYREIDGS